MAVTALAVLSTMLPAGAETAQHCVVELVRTPRTDDAPSQVDLVDLGCFDTYAEAIEVGTDGDTVLPAGTAPFRLTQRMIDQSSDPDGGYVLIGTEWVHTGYDPDHASHSYFAVSTCAPGTSWEVSNVGTAYNDDFASGKGFGGCDTNKKFELTNFGGDVKTCTPNCWGYGELNNEISSLKWRS